MSALTGSGAVAGARLAWIRAFCSSVPIPARRVQSSASASAWPRFTRSSTIATTSSSRISMRRLVFLLQVSAPAKVRPPARQHPGPDHASHPTEPRRGLPVPPRRARPPVGRGRHALPFPLPRRRGLDRPADILPSCGNFDHAPFRAFGALGASDEAPIGGISGRPATRVSGAHLSRSLAHAVDALCAPPGVRCPRKSNTRS